MYEEAVNLLRQYHSQKFFRDAVLYVFDKDRILERLYLGQAGQDTWFDLASLTKIYTSLTALRMMERNIFSLEDTIDDLLPQAHSYPALEERFRKITVFQLMTHTSGILPWYPFYTQQEDFYPALNRILDQNGPVAGMNYSDINFMLMGKIIESLSDLSLPEAMQNYGVTEPNEADWMPRGSSKRRKLAAEGKIAISSYGNTTEEQMCRERGLCFEDFRDSQKPIIGEVNDGNSWYYFNGVSGHAGLFATIDSLIRLGQFFLQTDTPLYVRATNNLISGRGLGFETDEKFPGGCGHSGFTGTGLWICRDYNIGAALLANRLAFPNQITVPDMVKVRKELFLSLLHERQKYV